LVNNQAQITTVFAALADPTRRGILARLASGGEGPVAELSKPFHISPPAISRHLRVLEKARLIGRRRAGRVHLIRARPAGFKQAQEWMTHLAAGWNYSFDALDRLLINEERKEKQK
jgi:DNA-binding transcriptional ArsR family regulator